MKHKSLQTRPAKETESGIALVLVLFFLVILSGIILAFFSSVTTESTTAASYAAGASAKMLSEAVVNVVEAQIQDATKGLDSSTNSPLSWASQPGAVHTFDSTGNPKTVFKLYSADDLVVPDATFTQAHDVVPGDWNNTKYTDVYTDLNQPVADSTGTPVYPIVDPDAESYKVDGFSIDKHPGSQQNGASMPVKWLYLLQDGTLTSAATPGSDTANVSVPNASATNPIVGRVAFWTDDESSKVNINTASEGTYWDVPRIYSLEDFGSYQGTGSSIAVPGMSICQPAQHEFQRYPGHPATTSLSAIFGNFPSSPLKLTDPLPLPMTSSVAKTIDDYYKISPRTAAGGSESGSKQASGALAYKQDRLYSSVDELLFSTVYNGSSTDVNNPGNRVPNMPVGTTGSSVFDKKALDKVKFFLTANSNAPETTLFNTPRISIWPVSSDPAKQTAYDKLSVFCSTIGKQAYYFPRSNPRDSTADFNIGRNQTLYKYLQTETSQPIPGFGGNFLSKYGTDRDQILTFIYDYIRCTNLQDHTAPASYTPFFPALGAGEVVPIKTGNTTQGFGRFYSISEADLIFWTTATGTAPNVKTTLNSALILEFSTPLQGLGCMRNNMSYSVSGLEKLQVQFNNGPGPALLGFVGVQGQNGTNYLDIPDLSLYHGRSLGGTEGPTQGFLTSTGTLKPFSPGSAAHNTYPFCTPNPAPVVVPANATSFSMQNSGGTGAGQEIVVTIKSADTQVKIQEIHLTFPTGGSFKVPGTTAPAPTSGAPFNLVPQTATVIGVETSGPGSNDPKPAIDHTVGDSRMVASLPVVTSNRFRAHQNYIGAQPVQWAHSLLAAVGKGDLNGPGSGSFLGATFGKLVKVSTYKQSTVYNERQPDVPSRADTFVTRIDGHPGDWDLGLGDQKDGAYINKPDEGDSAFTDAQPSRDRLPYLFGFGQGSASATTANFSPNRQIPSAMMFGSIPTGVQRFQPWQTLCFCPRPEDPTHPGNSVTPRDHLIADLFWMPVIEPYAISQPFSTAGKINMNYQIQPFTYIHRSTGLYAALKSTKFLALPLTDSVTYKPIDPGSTGTRNANRRYFVEATETLKAFDQMFAKGQIFKSATQICEMNLVPYGKRLTDVTAFWAQNPLTGDNMREKPYVDLYPRLTTKSNTFTVHMRVQSLKKARNTPADQWVHGKDLVAGEYRGSAIIERYIDPNDSSLPDFATIMHTNPSDTRLNIDQYYKMRIVSTKQFSPN